MNMMATDLDLLRDFSRHGSQEAFTALVRRNLPLVYSAALRQVRSHHLAEEVAQSVFIDLARMAEQLKPDTLLSSWLYTVTYRTAVDVIRTEVRRRALEQVATEMNPPQIRETTWQELAPVLDEAMHDLNEPDRVGLILRYFENQTLREVGEHLGISEDAAQKRVSRALEQLRSAFSKRQVTPGLSCLGVILSANGVQAAPTGLTALICAQIYKGTLAATTTAGFKAVSTASHSTQALTMTTLQKVLFVAIAVVVVGGGFYQARQLAASNRELNDLRVNRKELADRIDLLTQETDEATRKAAGMQRSGDGGSNSSSDLARLNAENLRLLKELADRKAGIDKARAEVQDLLLHVPRVKRFFATADVSASWDQGILTEGWVMPSGKRVALLILFEKSSNLQQVAIKSHWIEYPDEAGDALGLSQYYREGQLQSETHVISHADSQQILSQPLVGVNILNSPAITTLSGRQGQFKVQEMHTAPSGEDYFTGPVLDLFPQVSADGTSVQLKMAAQMNVPVSFPEIHWPE